MSEAPAQVPEQATKKTAAERVEIIRIKAGQIQGRTENFMRDRNLVRSQVGLPEVDLPQSHNVDDVKS